MRSLGLAMCLLLVACQPSFPEGQFYCTTASDCPDGWVCASSFCYDGSSDDPLPDPVYTGGTGGTVFAGSGGSAGTGGNGGSAGEAGSGGSGGTQYFCTNSGNACVCVVSASGTSSDDCSTPKPPCCFKDAETDACLCYPESESTCSLRGSETHPAVTTCPTTSPGTVSQNEVACVEVADPTDKTSATVGEAFCTCDSAGEGGSPRFVGDACGTHSDRQLCCADANYPDSGSCSCLLTLDWVCRVESDSLCRCGYEYVPSGLTLTTVCDNVAEPDGTPWECCNQRTDDECLCRVNVGVTCPQGTTDTPPSCIPTSVAGHTAPTACPAGKVHVNSCSDLAGQ